MKCFKNYLKELSVKALKSSKKLQLSCRPEGVKFDENRVKIRFDIDTYKGFSIGDLCFIKGGLKTFWLRHTYTEQELVAGKYRHYRIAAFIELEGNIIGAKGKRIRDMFCILAEKKGPSLDDYLIVYPDGPILFWVESLQKIEEDYHLQKE